MVEGGAAHQWWPTDAVMMAAWGVRSGVAAVMRECARRRGSVATLRWQIAAGTEKERCWRVVSRGGRAAVQGAVNGEEEEEPRTEERDRRAVQLRLQWCATARGGRGRDWWLSFPQLRRHGSGTAVAGGGSRAQGL
ncbi:Type I phosphodiesterase / nucleotide pyrophosphatase family [Sesbania bispinosa]|nr:Type I phosphodiesterase / nucleotide pyrophosphatase family [Sesbania bispinosa]